MTPRVVLVGNAPSPEDRSREIDAADLVVRFNDARGFGAGTGSRVDELFLVNRGGAAAEWLEDATFAHRPVVAAAGRVLLPLHPASRYLGTRAGADGRVHRDDRDHGDALETLLASPARRVVRLTAGHHERCCEALGLVVAPCADEAVDDARPSTGFVALLWYAATLPPQARIVLHGFTFEGWPGHPWAREREHVARLRRAGRVELVPVRAPTLRTPPGTPLRRSAGSAR